MEHDAKQKWKYWQIKIDVNSFNLYAYLSDNPTDLYLWNEAQTNKPEEDWWIVEALEYIKKGDNVLLWVHGNPIGIYALGEVIDNPFLEEIQQEQEKYYLNKNKTSKKVAQVPIKITVSLFSNPITQKETRNMGVSQYHHPVFGTLYNSQLPENSEPLKNYNYIDISYGEDILDEYSVLPFFPIKHFVWERINQYINTKGQARN